MHGAHGLGGLARFAAHVDDEPLGAVHGLLALHALVHGGQELSRKEHEDDAPGEGLGENWQEVFPARPERGERVGHDVSRGGGPAREAAEKPGCHGGERVGGRKKGRASGRGVHGKTGGGSRRGAGARAASDRRGQHESDRGGPSDA